MPPAPGQWIDNAPEDSIPRVEQTTGARSDRTIPARLRAAPGPPLKQMGTAAPAIGASEAFQGTSKFSGRDENSDNITFGPTLDQDRLQHPGPMGQMVDVPSDRLALPKVALHPCPHAARTIGAPCINITSRLKVMRSVRSAKEHWLGKMERQRIGPARRWRR